MSYVVNLYIHILIHTLKNKNQKPRITLSLPAQPLLLMVVYSVYNVDFLRPIVLRVDFAMSLVIKEQSDFHLAICKETLSGISNFQMIHHFLYLNFSSNLWEMTQGLVVWQSKFNLPTPSMYICMYVPLYVCMHACICVYA